MRQALLGYALSNVAQPVDAPRIPQILHYVWVGPNPVPERDQALIDGWASKLPGWTIRAWTDREIDYASSPWLTRAYAMQAWNRVAYYVRLDCLRRHGGVYLDTDVELLKPLDPLLSQSAFIGYQTQVASPHWTHGPHWVNNAVMGAVPGHWFPEAVMQHILTTTSGERSTPGTSGPGAVTRVLLEAGMPERSDEPVRVKDVTVYPPRYFYPYGPEQTPADLTITPDTYAIHHWAATWVDRDRAWPLSKKIKLRVARYAPRLAYAWTRWQLTRS
jgi:hypothetical protein